MLLLMLFVMITWRFHGFLTGFYFKSAQAFTHLLDKCVGMLSVRLSSTLVLCSCDMIQLSITRNLSWDGVGLIIVMVEHFFRVGKQRHASFQHTHTVPSSNALCLHTTRSTCSTASICVVTEANDFWIKCCVLQSPGALLSLCHERSACLYLYLCSKKRWDFCTLPFLLERVFEPSCWLSWWIEFVAGWQKTGQSALFCLVTHCSSYTILR